MRLCLVEEPGGGCRDCRRVSTEEEPARDVNPAPGQIRVWRNAVRIGEGTHEVRRVRAENGRGIGQRHSRHKRFVQHLAQPCRQPRRPLMGRRWRTLRPQMLRQPLADEGKPALRLEEVCGIGNAAVQLVDPPWRRRRRYRRIGP